MGLESLALEQRPRRVADFAGKRLGAARRGEADERVDERGGDAAPREAGIDIEHVDRLRTFETGEAGRLAVDQRHQRQRAGEALGEGDGIVGARRPGGALVGAVILDRQFFDAERKIAAQRSASAAR